jgi:hypothetical protein
MGIAAKFAVLTMSVAFATSLAGCDKDRNEMRPDMDTVRTANGLQSRDIREMTDRMASDVLTIPEIVQNPTRITIVVKGMVNKTDSEPGRNYGILTARLAGLLNTPQTRDRVLFVEERAVTGRMQAEELGNPDPFEDGSRGGMGRDPAIKPQFFLYGDVFSMNEGSSTYYLCKFKLTSSATGAMVWSKDYETKTLNVR